MNEQDIESELIEIKSKLRSKASLSKNQLEKIDYQVLMLIKEAVLIHEKNSYTPWIKEHIFQAINAINWGWCYSAIAELQLSFADPDTISPDNKYAEEIQNLKSEDFCRLIKRLERTFVGK
jgi:ABC-type Fe3+-citrate transport system substrate-binding protein